MIDVALVTWPNHPKRIAYFVQTVAALRANLMASSHSLRFLCSAETEQDPRSQWCGAELEQYCMTHGITLSWRHAKPNLGANMNAALRLCSADLIYLHQDDWRLLYPLDLSPGASFLSAHSEVDLLRYSWPDNDRMRPTFIDRPDGFRQVDVHGKWPYGDDPHLRRRDFMDKWGWYLEGGPHASASAQFMTLLKQQEANIRVADRCYYQHFGQISSYPNEPRQGRKRY